MNAIHLKYNWILKIESYFVVVHKIAKSNQALIFTGCIFKNKFQRFESQWWCICLQRSFTTLVKKTGGNGCELSWTKCTTMFKYLYGMCYWSWDPPVESTVMNSPVMPDQHTHRQQDTYRNLTANMRHWSKVRSMLGQRRRNLEDAKL